ncbi:hypothetical protein SteCoe_27193 [Stentor coeruleus]|uniref:Uncharacterized protein n=1 Tax=Stentor coeruleus TaxID=5963 RepID=A0A1R2BB39_9CILI|nr:hypothetical protein SteCoe_27193 [Stentor coeruleus]
MEKIDQNLQKSLKRKSCPILKEDEEELKKQKFDVILDIKVLRDLSGKDNNIDKNEFLECDNLDTSQDIAKDMVLKGNDSVLKNESCVGVENNDNILKAPPNTQTNDSPEKSFLFAAKGKLDDIAEVTKEDEESKTNEKSQKKLEGYGGEKGSLNTQKNLEMPVINEILTGEKCDEGIGYKEQKDDLENSKSQTSLVAT